MVSIFVRYDFATSRIQPNSVICDKMCPYSLSDKCFRVALHQLLKNTFHHTNSHCVVGTWVWIIFCTQIKKQETVKRCSRGIHKSQKSKEHLININNQQVTVLQISVKWHLSAIHCSTFSNSICFQKSRRGRGCHDFRNVASPLALCYLTLLTATLARAVGM